MTSSASPPSLCGWHAKDFQACLVIVCALGASWAWAEDQRSGRPAPVVQKRTVSRPVRRAAVDPFGRVSSVTAEFAFLNRGSADGLNKGQNIALTRSGKPSGKCIVEAVSEHFARCVGSALSAGDIFPLSRKGEPGASPPSPFPSEAEMQHRAAAVEALQWQQREFDASNSQGTSAGPRFEAFLSHTTYGNPGSANGPFGVQRLDVAVYDVEVWKGLRASVDVSALNFSARPANSRMVYQTTPVFLVRQLELSFRRADIPFSAALGRTWLRASAGMMVVDGAQAAWQLTPAFELGAYGGLLPDAARLSITPSQWAAGAFGRLRYAQGSGATASVVQLSARAGFAVRDALGGRGELGLTASLWRGQLADAQASVELGFGQTQAPAGVDAARLDLGWRPFETLRVFGALRYRGLPLTGLTEVGLISPGQRAVHSDGGLSFEIKEGLLVGAQGGLASDFVSGLLQARVGPEISLPHLFGTVLGVSLGYLEEFGWLRGRHGYAQLNIAPAQFFRLLTRTSWFQQQWSTQSAGLAGNELGASVALEITPWRLLKARVVVMGRLPLTALASPLGSIGVQVGGGF